MFENNKELNDWIKKVSYQMNLNTTMLQVLLAVKFDKDQIARSFKFYIDEAKENGDKIEIDIVQNFFAGVNMFIDYFNSVGGTENEKERIVR